MNSLTACAVNETERIFLKKKTMVLLIITMLIPVLGAIGVGFFQKGLGIMPVSASEFSVWILGIFTNFLLPLFIGMAAVDLFAGEIGDRSIKITLLRPVSRLGIFSAKIIALAAYIVVNLGIIFLVSSFSTFFLEGKEGLIWGMTKGLLAYNAAILPMLLIAIAAVFIAQLFKNSSGALVILILIYFGLNIVSTVFPGISNLMITSYTDWHLLWTAGWGQLGRIFTVFMFILSYSIIFLASGFYLFERREL
ncbi:MAG: ABC transporter permease [Clostridia bacterium]|nr:ABC transporter permease [Clostridia bacterium]